MIARAVASWFLTQPSSPSISDRVLDVIQTLATLSGSLAIIWAFVEKVGKPYHDWRLKRRAEIIREILKDELGRLDALTQREEELVAAQENLLERQREVFRDLDTMLDVALDNRDRLDEINVLLNELGLSSRDRRSTARDVTAVLEGLLARRKARLRNEPLPVIPITRIADEAARAEAEHNAHDADRGSPTHPDHEP